MPATLDAAPWEANTDGAAHLRDSPTHSVTVVEERRGASAKAS